MATSTQAGFVGELTERRKRKDDKIAGPTTIASSTPKATKDTSSILLLLCLYILQGIPLGLSGSVPMLLQANKIGYRQQAMFSLVSWPFSLKLLWAPFVDASYSRSFGRRKSWLVPIQYGIGALMFLLSYTIDDLMGGGGGATPPNVFVLTVAFFALHFLAATQDVAVDGWALTMLSKENVGYASTCNSVGQTAGYFLGYTAFLALESKDFCNAYLRWGEPQERGIMDLSTFLFFWGVVFVVVTSLVWLFKREEREGHAEEKQGVLSAYLQLVQVLKLPSVQTYILLILTSKVAFSAADNITALKLIENGLPRDKMALMALPMIPLQIILPLIISRATNGPCPLDLFTKSYFPRLVFGLAYAGLVLWTPHVGVSGQFPLYYYVVVVGATAVHQIFVYNMFVSLMAFNARVSDPAIGGTYMTLLNTVANIAVAIPKTVSLWLVDVVSFKDCTGVTDFNLDCDNFNELQLCEAAGGKCVTNVDGYYVLSIACILLGLLWMGWQRNRMNRLQALDEAAWKCSPR